MSPQVQKQHDRYILQYPLVQPLWSSTYSFHLHTVLHSEARVRPLPHWWTMWLVVVDRLQSCIPIYKKYRGNIKHGFKVEVKSISIYRWGWVSEWVSEWLLFIYIINTKWVIFQPYHGRNKLHFNERNNSPSPHSDTLSWFRENQSLLSLLNAACLA